MTKTNIPTMDLLADLKYLKPEVAVNEIKEMTAQLELDRHRLRIQLALNGMDGEAKLQSGLTINDAIKLTNSRISTLESLLQHELAKTQEVT